MVRRVDRYDRRPLKDQPLTAGTADNLGAERCGLLQGSAVREDRGARFGESAGCDALLETLQRVVGDVDHAALRAIILAVRWRMISLPASI